MVSGRWEGPDSFIVSVAYFIVVTIVCGFSLSTFKDGLKIGFLVFYHTILDIVNKFAKDLLKIIKLLKLSDALISGSGSYRRIPARKATRQELLTVHTWNHLCRLESIDGSHAQQYARQLSLCGEDTYVNAYTYKCARLAAGSAAEIANQVADGQATCGAAIIRPPGELLH